MFQKHILNLSDFSMKTKGYNHVLKRFNLINDLKEGKACSTEKSRVEKIKFSVVYNCYLKQTKKDPERPE